MTIQQKHDSLLIYLVKLQPTPIRGQVILNQTEVAEAIGRCQVSNNSELGSFVRSLDSQGLVESHCAGDDTIIGATVTMLGYST